MSPQISTSCTQSITYLLHILQDAEGVEGPQPRLFQSKASWVPQKCRPEIECGSQHADIRQVSVYRPKDLTDQRGAILACTSLQLVSTCMSFLSAHQLNYSILFSFSVFHVNDFYLQFMLSLNLTFIPIFYPAAKILSCKYIAMYFTHQQYVSSLYYSLEAWLHLYSTWDI